MSYLKKKTILFDLAHNEMLNIEENEFSEFLAFLQLSNVKILKNKNRDLTRDVLQNADILVIGNPINNYFSNVEIKHIVNYVRKGGNLLLISEYGADSLQKTNLNDLSGKHFGIFFKKNIVKEHHESNTNCSSMLHVHEFQEHEITRQIREVIIGGTCSFYINKNTKPLIKSNDFTWTEIYNDSTNQWMKEEEKGQIIAAYTKFGRGKVIALGDIDIFTNDPNSGLNKLDNRKFILNILNWLIEPIKNSDVMLWTLNQLGALQNELKEMNNKINNIIETITIIEKRQTYIEQKINNKEEEILNNSLERTKYNINLEKKSLHQE